jgi:hypothetical protein
MEVIKCDTYLHWLFSIVQEDNSSWPPSSNVSKHEHAHTVTSSNNADDDESETVRNTHCSERGVEKLNN